MQDWSISNKIGKMKLAYMLILTFLFCQIPERRVVINSAEYTNESCF